MRIFFTFIFLIGATLFAPVSNATFQSSSATYKKDGALYSSPQEACSPHSANYATNNNTVCGSLDWHWTCTGGSTNYVCGPFGASGTGPSPPPSNSTCNEQRTKCTCNAGYTEVSSFLTGVKCESIASYVEHPSAFAIGAGIVGGALTTGMVAAASGLCATTPMICAAAIAAGAVGGGFVASSFRSDGETVVRTPADDRPAALELNLNLNGTAATDAPRVRNTGQGNLRPFNGSGASGTWSEGGASGTWENSGTWTDSSGNSSSWNNFLDENNDSAWSSSTTSHAGGGGSLNNATMVAAQDDGTIKYWEYYEEWTNEEGTEKIGRTVNSTVASDGTVTVIEGGEITYIWTGTTWIAVGTGDGGGDGDGDGGGGDGEGGGDGGGDGDGEGEGDCATYGCAKETTLQQVLSQLQNTDVNASSVLTAVNSNAQQSLDDVGDAANSALEAVADDSALSGAFEGLEELNYIGILSGNMGFGNCVPLNLDFISPGGATISESIDLCDRVDDLHLVLTFFLFLAFVMGVFELFTERPE